MFFRSRFNFVFLCVLAVTTTASAQSRRPTFDRDNSSVTVAVSPDGFVAAVARSGGGSSKRFGRVDLWDTRTGGVLRTITGFDGPIWSMRFSGDGRSLITVSTEYRESKIQANVKDRQEKVF